MCRFITPSWKVWNWHCEHSCITRQCASSMWCFNINLDKNEHTHKWQVWRRTPRWSWWIWSLTSLTVPKTLRQCGQWWTGRRSWSCRTCKFKNRWKWNFSWHCGHWYSSLLSSTGDASMFFNWLGKDVRLSGKACRDECIMSFDQKCQISLGFPFEITDRRLQGHERRKITVQRE